MQLSVGGLRLASSLARVVPNGVARAVTRSLSRVAARRSPEQRLIVERNMRRAYGLPLDSLRPDDMTRRAAPLPPDAPIDEATLQQKVHGVFDNYAAYWLESLRLPSVSVEELDQGITYEGLEHLMVPVEAGGGVICALPHLGGWEWAGRWLTEVLDMKLAVAVEQLEPAELYEWFLEYRRDELGMQVVPVGPHAALELAAALQSGATLALLCDRDLTGDGIEVEFFGERTSLPGGPALLALRSGCPLVPVGVFSNGDHHHAVLLPPIDTERRGRLRADVTRVTQDLAHALEELICRDPAQWHMFQPNWPSDFDALGRPRPSRSDRDGAAPAASA